MLFRVFLKLLVFAVGTLGACAVEQPGVQGDKSVPFAHSEHPAETCSTCHEVHRPTPTHGSGSDCRACHTPNDEHGGWVPKPGVSSGDNTAPEETPTPDTGGGTANFNHDPPPTSCRGCHEKDRLQTASHPKSGDCVSCHTFPSWKRD